jgi:hypothetical protein
MGEEADGGGEGRGRKQMEWGEKGGGGKGEMGNEWGICMHGSFDIS